MIDLHLHTNYSDGTDSVIELLENAERQKIELLSITDHDTVEAYIELQNTEIREKFKGEIITGVELKAIYNNHNIEILGYGFDVQKLKIYKYDNLQEKILEHFKKIAEKYEIIFDKDLKIDEKNNNIFASFTFAKDILQIRENISKLGELGEKPLTEDNFFRKCESNPSSIFYFDASKYIRNLNDIIEDIHQAGGLAFLAHAYEYGFKNTKQEIENIIKTTNIDGFECQHSIFTEEQKNEIMQICQKYNKYMSGGSDYHAKNKPQIEIGRGKNNNIYIQKEFVEKWVKVLPKI